MLNKYDSKKSKIPVLILIVSLFALFLSACASEKIPENSYDANNANNINNNYNEVDYSSDSANVNSYNTVKVKYDSDDEVLSHNESDISSIKFNGDSISVEGNGAAVKKNTVTITSAGTYSISGTLSDGQLIVDTEDEDTVYLLFKGVDISCSSSSPIFIMNAEKTVITLIENTENYVSDGTEYIFEDPEADEPDSVIFSKDDLTINGSGSLIVNGNYNDGITSKDDLKITGGNITVNAVDDGIRGRDLVAVKDGIINIDAQGDGIKSNNDEDTEKGNISIEGGTINITAGADGIQAETSLVIYNGNIAISSGGGSSVSSYSSLSGKNIWGNWNTKDNETNDSAKGLKAGVNIIINGGTIDIDSSDDSIHSNDSLTINNGVIYISSGDDGIHADSSLEINGGDISIEKCYEGIESTKIKINDGDIHIVAMDDGINVAGGNDGSSLNGRPGQNNFSVSSDYYIYINGGYIAVDAAGDGIDSNGSIYVNRGTILVNGPTNNGNGALDCAGNLEVNGGLLVAAGSLGMAETPDTSSSQYSVGIALTTQSADTIFHIETESGKDILTFAPSKTYQSVVFSCPELENGTSYVVYTGGSSTGDAVGGLYTNGEYTAGSEVISFKISNIVTNANQSGVNQSNPFGGGDKGRFDRIR